jgi:hypothetical protein
LVVLEYRNRATPHSVSEDRDCASAEAASGCGAPVDFAREHVVNVAKAIAANVQWRIGMTHNEPMREIGFNQIKTKTTELVIVRAGPVEKSIELTTYPMLQEPEGTYD